MINKFNNFREVAWINTSWLVNYKHRGMSLIFTTGTIDIQIGSIWTRVLSTSISEIIVVDSLVSIIVICTLTGSVYLKHLFRAVATILPTCIFKIIVAVSFVSIIIVWAFTGPFCVQIWIRLVAGVCYARFYWQTVPDLVSVGVTWAIEHIIYLVRYQTYVRVNPQYRAKVPKKSFID